MPLLLSLLLQGHQLSDEVWVSGKDICQLWGYVTLHENRRMYGFVSNWVRRCGELALNGVCQNKNATPRATSKVVSQSRPELWNTYSCGFCVPQGKLGCNRENKYLVSIEIVSSILAFGRYGTTSIVVNYPIQFNIPPSRVARYLIGHALYNPHQSVPRMNTSCKPGQYCSLTSE